MLRLEAGQRWGVRIPCEVSGVPPIRRGSGGPQKPFSSLSEGLRGIFTIITEAGEMTCVPPPYPQDHHFLVIGGAGQYSLRTFPRNVCRNAWETVVL